MKNRDLDPSYHIRGKQAVQQTADVPAHCGSMDINICMEKYVIHSVQDGRTVTRLVIRHLTVASFLGSIEAASSVEASDEDADVAGRRFRGLTHRLVTASMHQGEEPDLTKRFNYVDFFASFTSGR